MHYTLTLEHPERHLIGVAIDAATGGADALEFAMPAWSPGRYYIYDFARNVQNVAAHSERGRQLNVVKSDTGRWRVECGGAERVRFTYRVYADTISGTFSQFNARHAAINGSSVFMALVGAEAMPIVLSVERPEGWEVHTALPKGRLDGRAVWRAANYDVLLDSPIEVGTPVTRRFTLDGVVYHIVLDIAAGPATLGSERTRRQIDRYVEDVKKIVGAYTDAFGRPEFKAYWFIANIDPWAAAGDGMEHLASTRLVLAGEFTDAKGYDDLIAVTSHEFFHIWNVKRLRPRELGPFDYSRPGHTTLLWFAEGFTQYYGIMALSRAGVWDETRTLRELSAEINQVDRSPGRRHRSLREASWDTWLAAGTRSGLPYASNIRSTWVNYYHKGAIVALVLDASIRSTTAHRRTLDDVLRTLYHSNYSSAPEGDYFLRGEGYTENDVLDAVEKVAGRALRDTLEQMVAGTDDPDLDQALEVFGLELVRGDLKNGKEYTKGAGDASSVDPSPPYTGIVLESAAERDGFPLVGSVAENSPAERAGLGAGDMLLALDGERIERRRWESLVSHYAPGQSVEVTLFRGAQLSTVSLTLAADDERSLRIRSAAVTSSGQRRARRCWLSTTPVSQVPL